MPGFIAESEVDHQQINILSKYNISEMNQSMQVSCSGIYFCRQQQTKEYNIITLTKTKLPVIEMKI